MLGFRTVIAVLGLVAAGVAQNDRPMERDWQQLDRAVRAEALRADVRFLADDLLGGRGVGTRGDALARLYLRTRLQQLGVEGGAPDGGYEQTVPIQGLTAEITEPWRVAVADGEQRSFEGPTDYVAWAGHDAAATGWDRAPLVFVGYGIHAPEQGWDDYGDVDLRGKVLLVMNDDPDWDPELFGGEARLYYGRWSYKYEEAARRGAVGAVVIHTTRSAGYPFQVIQAQFEKEQYRLAGGDDDADRLEIRAWCSEDAARQVCELAGEDLDALRERARSRDFTPVDLGLTTSIRTRNTTTEFESANILGEVPGSDPELAGEAVVVSAHFDHLGRGPARRDDSIYNGAIDNAAGCAAVLAMAEGIAALDPAPRRSVLFLLPTAEESGLLGTRYFARHRPDDGLELVANINFDFLNVWGPTEEVQVAGYGKNTLTDVLSRTAERRGRRAEPYARPDTGMFYRSDHFELARIGVPAVLLQPGDDFVENRQGRRRLKRSFIATRYHTPQDEYDERWNLTGMVADVRLALEATVRIADAAERPRWAPGDEFADRR